VKFVQSEKMWQGHTDTLITQTINSAGWSYPPSLQGQS